MERRLAAILFADVAGYSRMMEVDESDTLARMQALLAQTISPIVAAHRGRIVKTIGDGLLVEFQSVIGAVQAAIVIQQALASGDEDLSEERRFRMRIGINFGDVIVEEGDIHGSGVNIAARLESLAEPGGICFTRAVQEQVLGRLPVVCRDLGFQAMKNIAAPIQVFGIDPVQLKPEQGAGVGPRNASPDGEQSSIAVLPFVNMSGTAEHDPFCDGMTEDIITELSRFRTLRVISRNSSFQYRGAEQDVRRIGRELGVRYILEGSMRISSNRVRINGQLIDAQTGAHVWANRYDKELVDVFATQDAITEEIVNTIAVRLEDERLEQSRTKPPDNISAFEWYLQGKHAFLRWELKGMDEAIAAFQKAIECDPHYARAIAYLGYTVNMRTSFAGWGVSLDEPHERALQLARQAAELDPTDHMAEILLGWCRMFRRQYGAAKKHFERAIALNPNDSEALRVIVWYFAYTAQHAEAEALIARIRQLDPMLPSHYNEVLCAARILSGRYEEAIVIAEELPPDPWPEWPGWTAVAYAHLGRTEQAQARGAAFRRNLRERWRGDPNAGDAEMANWFFLDNPIQHDADIERFKEGWRIAGLDV